MYSFSTTCFSQLSKCLGRALLRPSGTSHPASPEGLRRTGEGGLELAPILRATTARLVVPGGETNNGNQAAFLTSIFLVFGWASGDFGKVIFKMPLSNLASTLSAWTSEGKAKLRSKLP
jgi:hypothetical protein